MLEFSAYPTSVDRYNYRHHSSLPVILGSSIGGGVLITVVLTACVICLIKRRNARGRHQARAPSRSESFFAAERPLVSPFPTLSRPQSHATGTSTAGTLTDEERWAAYRNAYQSPPSVPSVGGLVSRDTLLQVDQATEMLNPPAQMHGMSYAVLSRASPHSVIFPHEQLDASPAPSNIPLLPEDMTSVRAGDTNSYPSFTAPMSASPTSATFSQYIVYDGIEIGSVTDTMATPSGQRIPVAATNLYDSYVPSPGVHSMRGSFASLRSEGTAGTTHPDEVWCLLALAPTKPFTH